MSLVAPRTPEIVKGLEPYVDERFYSAHEMLCDETIGGVKTRLGRAQEIGNLDEDRVAGLDIRPRDESEEKNAVLLTYPFANDHQPHMQIRVDMTQYSLREPMRFIVLPNNTYNRQAYLLDEQERGEISGGNFAPMARHIGEMVNGQGIERVDLLGYSQGASVAASLISENEKHGYFEIRSTMLGDAPNVVDRTRKELIQDFMGGGSKPFDKAVRDSATPSLEDAQGIRYWYQRPRQMIGLGKFALSLKDPLNRAILSGMSRNTFAHSLSGAPESVSGVIAHAENSLVCPSGKIVGQEFPKGLNMFEIKGYGHEAGDNIATHALLAKMAIEGLDES